MSNIPIDPENLPEQGEHAPKPSRTGKVLLDIREKIFAYLLPSYKDLEAKEYLGQRNQGEFDRLLSSDFQEQLRDNPPIGGVFSPEDALAIIRSLPREQKKEALILFKENLARQRKALAACRVFIERSIEFNHDISREKLIGWIEKFSAHYGFNDRQKQIAERMIDGYYENRQRVLEVRRRFPDNHELVGELTGVNLGKDVPLDVSVGPMTIDIDTDGFTAGRLYEGADKPVVDFQHGGFAAQSQDAMPVYYIVINNDIRVWNSRNDTSGKDRRNHEYEHQKNKLFSAVFKRPKPPIALVGYRGESDLAIKKVILEDLFDARRTDALECVRDEITASLHDRDLPILQEQLKQFFFSGKGPYDYLGSLRNWELFRDDPLYQETAQRMLVQEYGTIIKNAVHSYAELVKKGKYVTQEATALLTDKPLADWPKTVRRLLEQQEAGRG